MYQHLNEDAIAYGWVTIVLFLIIGAAIWLTVWSGVIGELVPKVNDDVDKGIVTEQQHNAIQFNLDMGGIIPIWMILGAFVFIVVRSITRKA